MAAADASEAPAKRSPSDFLNDVIGRPVIVKLNTGTTYKGKSSIWTVSIVGL
jgi:U6 snRNA-associated Sm-like protein LSm6